MKIKYLTVSGDLSGGYSAEPFLFLLMLAVSAENLCFSRQPKFNLG